MHRISKPVFILFIVGLGVFNLISISYPTIVVNVTEINVDLEEQWVDVERDIRYPVTVENDWNHSQVSYEVIDDAYYIYWVIQVQGEREVDFQVNSPFESERHVFNETKFTLFQWGIGIDSIASKDDTDSDTLSFVSNSSGKYVFICKLNQSDAFPMRVNWVFSTIGEHITQYRVEILYNIQVETNIVTKKVSFVEKLILDYSKWSPFSFS